MTKICWRTVGAASMLEIKVLLVEMLSSSEAGIFFIVSEGTPATSVPSDCRETLLLICLTHAHLSKLKWHNVLEGHFIFNTTIIKQ